MHSLDKLRQTFVIINNIFSTTSSKLSSSSTNFDKLSRRSSTNFRDHQQHLLDNFVKTFVIFIKLPRNCVHTFHELSYHFQTLLFYSSGTSFLDTTFFHLGHRFFLLSLEDNILWGGVGAAGARRPSAGHGDILAYYFFISQPILDVSSFNNNAKSRNAFFKLS